MDVEISLLTKGLNFVPICSNIDKGKLILELEAFRRKPRLTCHFRNKIKNIYCDIFKRSSKFNLL